MNDLMTKSFLNYVDLKKQVRQDLESEINFESKDDPNLSQFFNEVDAIKVEMEEITNLLSDLQTLNEETKSAHSTKVLRGLRDRMESDIVAVLRKAKDVKERLDSLDKTNMLNRGISKLYKEGSPVDRTRVSVTNGLRVKMREIMNEFQFLRQKIISDYKDDLKRKYYAATGEEPSEEVVANMVSGTAGVQQLKRKRDFDGKSKERQEAVMDLLASLNRLHQVFLDMAIIVETQGEKMNDIEENIAKASHFVSGGTNSLHYANQFKKKVDWFQWVWVALIILLVFFIILLLYSG